MYYNIAGHIIEIDYTAEKLSMLLPSFAPFIIEGNHDSSRLLRLTVVQNLKRVPEDECHLIREVDTGNGMTRVDKLNDGGYQFIVRNVQGRACALLITSPRFDDCKVALRGSLGVMRFALNNALMLTYAFSSAFHDTLLIHASVIRHNNKAYAFTAKSGTGKSTQVANWLRYIPDCDMVNDDNPVIRIIDGKPYLFGSPWSGKTPCYRNIQADLGAILLIERDEYNHVSPMQPLTAFSTLITACSAMKWDEDLYQMVCQTCSRFVETITMATLHCLPDKESAEVCRNYLEPIYK